ncbi:MucR family transcriptional regulator [Candidatus Magnetaquicoccus inordinatus]|uniref:MucR family transcriptional regulator n=1 Tax=Candidatus Magnetaquicoccus inordinatus TaxID=2496818 RepID=UPI00187D4625|nr:MucR family transcriptional regulator [Candidatus Magnetaquicoccus inordinatus]
MKYILLKSTARIVAAYAAQPTATPEDVERMIGVVYRALARVAASEQEEEELEQGPEESEVAELALPPGRWQPVVPLEQAVTAESVTCLICGKQGKAIRGHLTKTHRIDIPTYLAVFGLPKDFPLVAPNYSATRRQLALASGAGEKLQAGRRKADTE